MATSPLTATALATGTATRRLTAVVVLLGVTFVSGILVLAATSPTGLPTVGTPPVVTSGASILEPWSPASSDLRELRAGRAPAADDEIALDLSTALTQRIRLGETVRLQGPQPGTFRVVGLVGSRGDGTPDASLVPLVLGGVLVLAGLVVLGSAIVRLLPGGRAATTSSTPSARIGARS